MKTDNKPRIHIEKARQHNLKNIRLDIPRDDLVVVCGPSGSGKSTLAFDIVYAEGQRRYVESLSAYARQFLPQMDKPDVEKIEGLSPAISLEQQSVSRNPRSTVGTVTEIHDFLRVFFARLGRMYCPQCGRPIEARAADEIIGDILALPQGTKFMVLAPLVELQKGTHLDKFKKLKAEGFARVRVDGAFCTLDDVPALDKNKKHSIDLVVDRLVNKEGIRGRLADSVELALRYGEGRLVLHEPDRPEAERDTVHSTTSVCPHCHISLPAPSPQLFSFNGPQGACPRCVGLGSVDYFEPRLIAPNRGLSLNTGALLPWATDKMFSRYETALKALGKRFKFTLSTPLDQFSDAALAALFYGEDEHGKPAAGSLGLRRNWMGGNVALGAAGDYQSEHFAEAQQAQSALAVSDKRWPGVIPLLEKGMQYGEAWREVLARFRQSMDCPDCKGARLNAEALSVRVDDLNIAQFCALSVERGLEWLEKRSFTGRHALIAEPLLKELTFRLSFMCNVGLEYISLGRSMSTLSGGEAQRIRLASQLGSGLVGVTYVLDEPSIGLHPSNIEGLRGVMHDLIADGNSIVLVDHDTEILRDADWLIEMGPGAGENGGTILTQGTVEQVAQSPASRIGPFLADLHTLSARTRTPEAELFALGTITLRTRAIHTVKPLEVRLPKGRLIAVTGVSGSGKTTLVLESLIPALEAAAKGEALPAHVESITAPGIAQVKLIDATPIGINVRSTVATYANVHDELRKIYARSPLAREKGYKAGDFSYNTGRLRCPGCDGTGTISLDIQFLPDVEITCPDCGGSRYQKDAAALYRTRKDGTQAESLPRLMEMSVDEALAACADLKLVASRLQTLSSLGLGYLTLGEATPSLSGGEAQRLKLASEMGKGQADTVFVFDEPTIGLHPLDVRTLLGVFQRLIDSGATVVVIEHDLDVIRNADYLVDLGPGGGESGGRIVACGTPEQVAADPASITGKYLHL